MTLRLAYLLLPRFRVYPREWIGAAARLQTGAGPVIRSVDACLAQDGDDALLRLRLEVLDAAHWADVVLWAHHEGAVLIDPQALSPDRRNAFFADTLPRFDRVAHDFVSPVAALKALVRARPRPPTAPPRRRTSPPPPPRLAQGTEKFKRAEIEWRTPPVAAAGRTRRTGNLTRTVSGVLGDRDRFHRSGTIA
ncbi:MAG: hypothetical protein D6689_03915 [Deltaproteobacteria bacterium]|nr:MAG: hypothetical protein D6689_03915 [Deltaproteobacteria bacterium]